MELGDSDLSARALNIVNGSVPVTTPSGVITRIFAEPAVDTFAARTVAVSWLPDTKVVISDCPFHCTVSPFRKLVPLTVNVNVGCPAVTDVGASDVIVRALNIVNGSELVATPSVVITLTLAVPALATFAAGTEAVSCVAETKVVVRDVPFHCTVSPFKKFVPFTVKVNAA